MIRGQDMPDSSAPARVPESHPVDNPRRRSPGTRRVALTCCLSGAALVALTACGSSSTGSASGSSTASLTTPAPASSASASGAVGSATPATAAAIIVIKGFAFTAPSSVSPGAKVTVRNMDGVAHTVTADSGSAFDDMAPPGDSSFTAPMTSGSYPFHCSIHPFMHGTLVVT
jgi:plastocyanin